MSPGQKGVGSRVGTLRNPHFQPCGAHQLPQSRSQRPGGAAEPASGPRLWVSVPSGLDLPREHTPACGVCGPGRCGAAWPAGRAVPRGEHTVPTRGLGVKEEAGPARGLSEPGGPVFPHRLGPSGGRGRAQERPLVAFYKVLGCCLEESSRGRPRGRRAEVLPGPPAPCPAPPHSSLPKPPEHGEGGGAVGDAHRGLRRVLPDPAHADHHLRLRVEVVSPPGAGGRGGAAGVTPHPFNPKCLPAPASRWPLAGALNVQGPSAPWPGCLSCHLDVQDHGLPRAWRVAGWQPPSAPSPGPGAVCRLGPGWGRCGVTACAGAGPSQAQAPRMC